MRACLEHDGLGCPMTRVNRVDGDGPVPCSIMLIGEAPGKTEDKKGKPFVGKAGSELTHLYLGKCARISRENVYITNLVKCIDGASGVKTGVGWRRVNWMHKHHFGGLVRCVDSNGYLQWGQVLGVNKTDLGGRTLYRVSPLFGKLNPRGLVGADFTEDHLMLTTSGWKRVDSISPYDKVHTGLMEPSEGLSSILIGMLLGDSSLRKDDASITTSHSIDQLEYLEYKKGLIGGDDWRLMEVYTKGVPHLTCRLRTTKFRAWFCKYHDDIYPNGRKAVTPFVLAHFSLVSLAFLFMDDGYLRLQKTRAPQAEIATCSFSYTDVGYLINKIKSLGINCYTLPDKKYPRIYFGKEGTRQLSYAIAPYVPMCMEYKLIPEHRGIRKMEVDTDVIPFYSEVAVLPSGKSPKSVYDLEIKDYHNFITHAGVAHNCRTNEKDRDPNSQEVYACSYLLIHEVRRVAPRFVGLVGKLATQWMLGDTLKMEKVHGFGYPAPTGGSMLLMPLYHPAFGLHNTAMIRHIMEDWERFGKMVRGDDSVMWRTR